MTIDEIENILLEISYKDSNEKTAVAAFTTLYRGYSKFLNSVVSEGLKSMGIFDEHVRDTVVNNTFFKLYENPLLFSFSENAMDDKGFKAWLSVVAKRDLIACISELYSKEKPYLEIIGEPYVEFEELSDEIVSSTNLKILSDALGQLSERDRHILMTIYMYYEEGKKTPSNELDILCELYDTTKPNIRKIRERSEKKIIDYFSKHSQLKPLRHVK